ncbi:hypothetical protein HDV00_004841 [Rhizophlyctis rosea]|nr:hypothetical protein HDV00_004841 [Rhizophlyctis rosea]
MHPAGSSPAVQHRDRSNSSPLDPHAYTNTVKPNSPVNQDVRTPEQLNGSNGWVSRMFRRQRKSIPVADGRIGARQGAEPPSLPTPPESIDNTAPVTGIDMAQLAHLQRRMDEIQLEHDDLREQDEQKSQQIHLLQGAMERLERENGDLRLDLLQLHEKHRSEMRGIAAKLKEDQQHIRNDFDSIRNDVDSLRRLLKHESYGYLDWNRILTIERVLRGEILGGNPLTQMWRHMDKVQDRLEEVNGQIQDLGKAQNEDRATVRATADWVKGEGRRGLEGVHQMQTTMSTYQKDFEYLADLMGGLRANLSMAPKRLFVESVAHSAQVNQIPDRAVPELVHKMIATRHIAVIEPLKQNSQKRWNSIFDEVIENLRYKFHEYQYQVDTEVLPCDPDKLKPVMSALHGCDAVIFLFKSTGSRADPQLVQVQEHLTRLTQTGALRIPYIGITIQSIEKVPSGNIINRAYLIHCSSDTTYYNDDFNRASIDLAVNDIVGKWRPEGA